MSRKQTVARGFTLIELLVVIAIIAIFMAILMPALSRAREQGKRAACMNNPKQLALAWNLYADDFDGKIVNANTGTAAAHRQSRQGLLGLLDGLDDGHQRSSRSRESGMGCSTAIAPTKGSTNARPGVRGEVETYSIPDAMNGYYAITEATKTQIKTLRTQIRNLSEQIVFLDEGRLSPSSWTIWYDQERWWDQITARHGDGTNFSFADWHSEYWKWKDPRTLDVAKADYAYWQNTGRNGAESTQPAMRTCIASREASSASWATRRHRIDGVSAPVLPATQFSSASWEVAQ